jgi:hypothetical protein
MPQGGSLEISRENKEGRIEINIKDTGKGISKKSWPKFLSSSPPNRGHRLGLTPEGWRLNHADPEEKPDRKRYVFTLILRTSEDCNH